jgi:1-deoxy-D-xylulose-5-phosphate reductoisomerase
LLKRLAVLGSTGSVGVSSLDVAAALKDRIQVVGLTAHRNLDRLRTQCEQFHPRVAVVAEESAAAGAAVIANWPKGTSLAFGPEAIVDLARADDVDIVLAAIVGAAGLRSTWAAVAAGKTVAIANKETLVVAGPLVMGESKRTGATLLPVDSEHNAVFQALACGRREEVSRVVLTASGGPFRNCSADQLRQVTVEQALAHPTWNMGKKITIDSATMMNKALEVIEARWLFDLDVDQIEVVVHPQSIVHSLVEFRDGSVLAQMSPPDMRLPIQYALTYPERCPGISPRLAFEPGLTLDFHPPDLERFPALSLGFDAARQGGSAGAVLNAANEVAVERFLGHGLGFLEIPRLCRDILESHPFNSHPTLDELIALDLWARTEARLWKSSQYS